MEVNGEDDLAALAASFNQMAENLQRHILRLEEMSRLQRRFTSDVSHELRTPLTTVRMAADLIFNTRDEFDPAGVPQRRAAAGRARPVREPAGRAARDQPVRRRIRRAGRRAGQPRPAARAGRRPAGPVAERAGVDGGARPADRPGGGRGRRPAGGADPAQPHRQRDRARRRQAGQGTAGRPGRRGRDHGSRPRRRPQAGRGEARLQPVLARRPVPGPADGRHRPRPVDQRRGRPAARRLARGVGRARAGRSVPADPADARRRPARRPRRCGWCRPTSGRRPRPSRRRRSRPLVRCRLGRRCCRPYRRAEPRPLQLAPTRRPRGAVAVLDHSGTRVSRYLVALLLVVGLAGCGISASDAPVDEGDAVAGDTSTTNAEISSHPRRTRPARPISWSRTISWPPPVAPPWRTNR